jgi:hypothetical protein
MSIFACLDFRTPQISRLYRRLPFHSACAKICRMLPDISEHKMMSRIPALVLFLAVGASSLSAKDVPFKTFDRNQVKRILLTERDPVN